MTKKLGLGAILFALVLGASQTALSAELNWVGCGITKKAFMQELANAYALKTGTTINIKGGGATKGIRDTAAGTADLGGSCRYVMDVPEEKDAVMTQVAWDALAVIVHKSNPVDNISTAQMKELLKGNIKNWKELGGDDAPLNLYVREGKISGVGRTLRLIVFEDPDVEFSPAALVKESTGPLEKGVSEDSNGIGVTGISSAVKQPDLKIIKVDNKYPDKQTVMSGEYPYFRPLFLVSRADSGTDVKNFLEFALSPEGQDVISRQGSINLAEGRELKNIAELEGLLY